MQGEGLGNLITWSAAWPMSQILDATAYSHSHPQLQIVGMFYTLGAALCCQLSIFVASTGCKIGLIRHLVAERRCDDIRQSCCGLWDKIPQSFSVCLSKLQVIKNWRCRRPEHETTNRKHVLCMIQANAKSCQEMSRVFRLDIKYKYQQSHAIM